MARTYKYHVPDAYRGTGGRRPETKRATCSTDPMLDLTHPYFRAAIADFKRFEGIEKDKPLTRRQAKLFEYRVLTGRIRVALPKRELEEAEAGAADSERFRGVQGFDSLIEIVRAAAGGQGPED